MGETPVDGVLSLIENPCKISIFI